MAMITHGNICEHITAGIDAFGNTTAAATSMAYDMTDYDKAMFIIGLGSAATSAPGRPEIVVNQSSNTTGSKTTVASTVTGGSTNASLLTNVKAFTITFGTEATNSTVALIINGTTFSLTTSTLLINNITASAASARNFGSTIGAAGASGLEEISSSLNVMLNNTTWGIGKIATCATVSTAAVRVEVVDTASTYFTVQTTGGASAIIAKVEKVENIIEVWADDMTTGQKFLHLSISTHGEGFAGKSVACIRTGRRAGGAVEHHHGAVKKSS